MEKLFVQFRKQFGSILLAALVVIFVVSFSIAALIRYVVDMNRINERALALERATATAEAGLHQLIHYFNKSDDVPSNVSGNKALIDDFFANGQDPAAIQAAGMTFINSSLNQNLIALNNGLVTSLRVTAPRTNATSGTVFTFLSVAQAQVPAGSPVQRMAIMDVRFNEAPRLTSPAAIIAGNGIGSNGHFNMHWGEGWAKSDVRLKMNKQDKTPYPNWEATGDNNQVNAADDQWVRYRSSQGYIATQNGTRIIDDPSYNYVGNYELGGDYFGILVQLQDSITPVGDPTLSQLIEASINQFSELGNPDNGYQFWKDAAIQRDTYFRPNSDGSAVYNALGQQLFLNGGELNTNGDGIVLTVTSAMEYYRTLTDAYIAFFDTTNGLPPAADGSNWVDINFTGSIDSRSQGVLYVAGDLQIGGAGNPPDVLIADPDGNDHSKSVFHDGVVFTYGDFTYQGNPIIYGSVITKGNYDGGGTPNIYYNIRLATGDPQPISTRAQILATVIQ